MDRRRIVGGLLGLVVLVVAAVVVLQRSDDDQGKDGKGGEESVAEAPAPLKAQWTADLSSSFVVSEPPRTVGDVIVLRARASYVGLDAATGERRWTHRVRGSMCAASTAPEDVAVYISGARCTSMTALDLASGKQLWRRRVPEQNVGGVNLKVEVGDRAITLRGSCDQILRFRRSDGHDLGVIAPHDRVCGHETDTDGQLIAVWYDPATDATPDDHGTGWIAPYDGAAALQLWDADSGTMLWSRTLPRRSGGLSGIVSAHPLVLSTTSHGQKTMRRFNARTGRPGAYVGLRLSGSSGFLVTGQSDGVLVGSYDGTSLVGYRLADGSEAWHEDIIGAPPSTRAVGVVDDAVLMQSTVPTQYDGARALGTWISRRAVNDGRPMGVHGWIPAAQQLVVAGDLLIATHSDAVKAYPLPDADPGLTVPAQETSEPDWQKDDVRSLTDAVGCPITDRTAATMGLETGTVPRPAECYWYESSRPAYVDRKLVGSITLARPSFDSTAANEAAQGVARWLEDARDHRFEAYPLRDPVQVDGWGDEAWVISNGSPDRSWSQTDVVVRVQNVVVTVRASIESLIAQRRGAVAPQFAVDDATLGAVRDLFASAGLDVDDPPRGGDGAVVRARDLCRLVAADAATLVPGARGIRIDAPRATDPRHRATGCAWDGGDYRPELTVSAYAVPGASLTGASANKTADELLGPPGRGDRRVKGLGDEAQVDSFTFEKGRSRTQTVTARRGNLLVVVEYGAWDQYGADARKRMDDDAIGIARKILKAHR